MTPWALWQQALTPFLPTPAEAAVDARETCSCGAHTRLNGTDWVTARNHLDAWRAGHRHETPREMPMQREGEAGSQVELAPGIGFSGHIVPMPDPYEHGVKPGGDCA